MQISANQSSDGCHNAAHAVQLSIDSFVSRQFGGHFWQHGQRWFASCVSPHIKANRESPNLRTKNCFDYFWNRCIVAGPISRQYAPRARVMQFAIRLSQHCVRVCVSLSHDASIVSLRRRRRHKVKTSSRDRDQCEMMHAVAGTWTFSKSIEICFRRMTKDTCRKLVIIAFNQRGSSVELAISYSRIYKNCLVLDCLSAHCGETRRCKSSLMTVFWWSPFVFEIINFAFKTIFTQMREYANWPLNWRELQTPQTRTNESKTKKIQKNTNK